MHKKTFVFGVLIGIILGFIISGAFVIYGMSEITNNLHIASINSTINIPFNSTEFAQSMTNTMIQNKEVLK